MNRKVYFIDLFCGAGGVTSGIHRAQYYGKQFAEVIACVNHDPLAIASHEANHPGALHYIEKIQVLDLTELRQMVEKLRREDIECLIFIWASLECTNFSKAKGGLPRDADSRTLAEHMYRYLEELQPDGLWIENVEEFMCWGPLDENGKPISKRNGEDYIRWVNQVKSYGYNFEYRILNAADFGAYTSRRRYFAQFMRPSIPIIWPVATHSKKPESAGLFGGLEKWRAVRDVLDFDDHGASIFADLTPRSEKQARNYLFKSQKGNGGKSTIVVMPASIESPVFGMEPKVTFDRKNRADFDMSIKDFTAKHGPIKFYRHDPYAEATLERVYAGLIKYVAGGKDAFITKSFSGRPLGKVIPIDGPAGTVTTWNGQALVNACFLAKYFSGNPSGMVSPVYSPAGSITTKDHHSIVKAAFIAKYYGNGDNIDSIESPAGTLTTKDRLTLVQTCWLDKYYSGRHNHQSVDAPAGTVLTNDKHALIATEGAFLMTTNFDNKPKSLHVPAPTITADRHHSYLVNPSWGGHPTGTDQPSPVIIARGDKAPMYLVVTENGELAIQIFPTDSPCMVRIKEFMAMYGIVDILMRMLKEIELLRIQGFGDGYVLKGTQSDRKRFIGNAVEVNQARVLIEASYRGIIEQLQLKTA